MAYSYKPGFGNAATRRSVQPTGSMPSSFPAHPSRRRAAPTSAPGCTASRPSVRHTGRFKGAEFPLWKSAPNIGDHELALGQYRWDPVPMPVEPTDFLAGMCTMTTAGDVFRQTGMAAHVYVANADMVDDHFFNADGEASKRLRRSN